MKIRLSETIRTHLAADADTLVELDGDTIWDLRPRDAHRLVKAGNAERVSQSDPEAAAAIPAVLAPKVEE